jgi:MFS family permease
VKRLKKLTVWDAVILGAALLFIVAVLCAGGCAVGTSLGDNTPMVGLRLGDGDGDALRDGAANVGGLIGGLFGGPGGATVGTGIGAVVGGLGAAFLGWRSKRKEDAAFDEGVARAAGVPDRAALPVAPVAQVK